MGVMTEELAQDRLSLKSPENNCWILLVREQGEVIVKVAQEDDGW